MKVTGKKFVLATMCSKAAGVLASKDIQPVLKNFLFETQDNELVVNGTDLKLAIVVRSTMVEIKEQGRALLPGKVLMEIIKEAPDGELTLETVGNQNRIIAGQAEWDLGAGKVDDYPVIPPATCDEAVELNRQGFLDAVAKVSFAAAEDNLRPALQIININGGRMRATDGAQYQEVVLRGSEKVSADFPISMVNELIKVLRIAEEETFRVSELPTSYLIFVGKDMFVAGKLAHKFPDVSSFVKTAGANDQMLSAEKVHLLAAIKRVRIVADTDTNALALNLSEDKLELVCKDRYGNQAKEAMPVFWKSGGRTIGVHAQYFFNMVNAAEGGSVVIYLGQDTEFRKLPLVFKSSEGTQLGILNQMKVKTPEEMQRDAIAAEATAKANKDGKAKPTGF